ncbi:MAG TPA: hypothetical protein VLE20_07035 [Blastocatellia bacterium]|jgi:hypothetical protein|nr:hypothetical protein [Blastocatellia bacterium]
MPNRILALTLSGLLVCALVSVQPASAATRPDKQTRLTQKVKAGILKLGTGKDSRVALKLRDKKVLAGYISEMNDTSFVVSDSKNGTASTVSYTDVTQVKGHNLSTGAKIAIGIGIGVGAALIVLAIYLNCCTG